LSDPQTRRYQFTLRRLLILSTALSIVFAIAGVLGGPLIVQLVTGAYLAIITAWMILRWPTVRENWRETQRARLAAIRAKRVTAIESARERKARRAEANQTEPPRA
jgi:membrane protein implicated in regulation of membrane protease activity